MPAPPTPTILLVDDDPSALENYGAFLRLEGFTAFTADTPAAALTAVASSHPDAVLLDLKMPEVEDGLGVLRALRARGDATPVCIITGHYALPPEVEAEIHQHCADIAYKPLWFEDCLAVIRRMLQRP